MKRGLLAAAIWLACLQAQPLVALEVKLDPNMTEEQIERLVSQAPKIHLPKLIAYNEAKLERIYQAKLKKAEPEYRDALQKAQEAWRAYHKADLVVGAMDTFGGSGQAVFAMERHVYQLRLRIYQLSTEYIQGWVAIPKVPEAPGK